MSLTKIFYLCLTYTECILQFDECVMFLLNFFSDVAVIGSRNMQHYSFLKTLCNVFSALGTHLTNIWTKRPPNFGLYLAAVEAFFRHPSLVRNNISIVCIIKIVPTLLSKQPVMIINRVSELRRIRNFPKSM